MTFTGKIRAYLILVALLPPLLVMTVVYFNSRKQMELSGNQAAYDDLKILTRLKEAGNFWKRCEAGCGESTTSFHLRLSRLWKPIYLPGLRTPGKSSTKQ